MRRWSNHQRQKNHRGRGGLFRACIPKTITFNSHIVKCTIRRWISQSHFSQQPIFYLSTTSLLLCASDQNDFEDADSEVQLLLLLFCQPTSSPPLPNVSLFWRHFAAVLGPQNNNSLLWNQHLPHLTSAKCSSGGGGAMERVVRRWRNSVRIIRIKVLRSEYT